MELEIGEIGAIPLYNADVEAAGPPESVARLKERVAAADALLFATPEYNYSIPGVLKNAIDWVSRPVATSPLAGKPIAMMGAGGGLGTGRSQYHLRQVAVFTNMLPINKPEVMVANAAQRFDQNGNLTDDSVKEQIRALLDALAAWVRRLRGELSA
jgi:chromate reductase